MATTTPPPGGTTGEPLELDGEMGLWLFTDRATLELGDHERADELREFDLGPRPLLRTFVEGDLVVGAGLQVRPA